MQAAFWRPARESSNEDFCYQVASFLEVRRRSDRGRVRRDALADYRRLLGGDYHDRHQRRQRVLARGELDLAKRRAAAWPAARGSGENGGDSFNVSRASFGNEPVCGPSAAAVIHRGQRRAERGVLLALMSG